MLYLFSVVSFSDISIFNILIRKLQFLSGMAIHVFLRYSSFVGDPYFRLFIFNAIKHSDTSSTRLITLMGYALFSSQYIRVWSRCFDNTASGIYAPHLITTQ